MSKISNKAIDMGSEIKSQEQEYFFPDMNGKQITVVASSPEEARNKALELTK